MRKIFVWLLAAILMMTELTYAQTSTPVPGGETQTPTPVPSGETQTSTPVPSGETQTPAPVRIRKTRTRKARLKLSKKAKTQEAVVIVEGAVVYGEASFDAPPISYLPLNKKVQISQKTYGPFYKVKLKKGSYGYISDVDVQVLKKDGDSPAEPHPKEASQNLPSKDNGMNRMDQGLKPIEEMRGMGLNFTHLAYSENLNGQEPLANVPLFGLKLSGPGFILPTPTDMNIAMSLDPPKYYESLAVAGQKPAGYLAYADFLLKFPSITSPTTMFYLGIGPFVSYLNVKVNTSTGVLNNSRSRFGLEGMAGLAVRMQRWLLQVEGKYFYEGLPFFGVTIGFLYSR